MSFRRSTGIGLAMLMALTPARAAQLKVYPVRIELTAKEPIVTMTVVNSGQEATLLQMTVSTWRQENGEDIFEPTRDILANPAIFELQPGARQIVRFGLQAGTTATERSYRVFLQEVPRRRPDKPGEVITLLRISVPIFVPADNAATQITWRAWPRGDGQVGVEIRNRGNTHVQVTSLKLAGADRREHGALNVSAYVLPGAWRRIAIPSSVQSRVGAQLFLKATTDQGDAAATVVSEAGPDEEAPR